MAETHPAQSDGPGHDRPAGRDRPARPGRRLPDPDRWQRAWSHREQLLRVARRRSLSAEDAEDAVHEAILRAAERPHLDDERLGAWLTTVTMRLCVDRYRQISREAEVRTSPRLGTPVPASIEDSVCDRAEARWLAARSGELPARQAEAIWLKSEDLDVAEVAKKMGLSYRTVESLLARARRTLRTSLAGTLGLAFWVCGRGRPAAGGKMQVAMVAATAVTLAVTGFVLPHMDGGPRPAAPRPGGSAGSGAVADGPSAERETSAGSGARPSPSPSGPGAGVGRGPLPLVSALPAVALPEVPLAELKPLPELPGEGLPTLPVTPATVPTPRLPPTPSARVPSTPVTAPE
ncbi:RNA polymerase sigma factor, partial [Streptomyces boluensis]